MKLGIRAKIILPITATVFLSFTAISIVLITQFKTNMTDAVISESTKILQENQSRVQAYLHGPEEATHLASIIYEQMAENGYDRESFIQTLNDATETNTEWLSVWAAFEPNAYDGKDNQFEGRADMASLPNGRFTPYATLDGNKSVASPMEVDGMEFYEVAKAKKTTHVTEPYPYEFAGKTVNIISICAPIIVNDVVIGVCGMDIALDYMSAELTNYKLFETGNVRLLSWTGTYVAHEDTSKIGTKTTNATALQAISSDGVFSESVDGNLYFYSRVNSLMSDGVWTVEIEVPESIAYKPINNAITTSIIALVISIVFIVIILVLLGNNVNNTVVKPVANLSSAAKKIAIGDLSVKLNAKGNDEISNLTRSFINMIDGATTQANQIDAVSKGNLNINVVPRSDYDTLGHGLAHMVDNLNIMFIDMSNSASMLDASATQVSDGSQNLAQCSTEQAASIDKLNMHISTLSENTTVNLGLAEKAASLGTNIKEFAEKGTRQMDNMMNAVQEISQASQAINKVMKVIDDIAFQTNILALNAAVEAARAGQHGKGFAVVAEEVRNLASKSASAAKDTGSLIANSIEKANLGTQISKETAASFVDIVRGVTESSEIVNEIANFVAVQNNAITEIKRGIGEVNTVIHMVSSSAEESAASSEEMSAQATSMANSLSQFELRDSAKKDRINNAKTLSLPSSNSFGKY